MGVVNISSLLFSHIGYNPAWICCQDLFGNTHELFIPKKYSINIYIATYWLFVSRSTFNIPGIRKTRNHKTVDYRSLVRKI
jgi:hypothetical protein